MDTIDAIRERRTHKEFTGQPVARETLEALLDLAVWAPNHRMTEPWRFFVVTAERIPDLAAAVDRAIKDDDHPKLLRKKPVLARRLPKLGAFIAVGRRPVPDDPLTDQEDYAACSCAVYAILLAATAMGLGSFWSTGKVFKRPKVRELLGMPDEMELVAAIWLGTPVAEARSARRSAPELTHWVD